MALRRPTQRAGEVCGSGGARCGSQGAGLHLPPLVLSVARRLPFKKDQPDTTRRATYDPAPREAVVVGEGVSWASFGPPSGAVPARDARLTTHTRQTQRFVTLDADSKQGLN